MFYIWRLEFIKQLTPNQKEMTSKGLKITPKKKSAQKKADPKTTRFNKLLKEIELYEKERGLLKDALDKALKFKINNLNPAFKELNNVHVDFIKVVFKLIPSLKLKRDDEEDVRLFLQELIEDLIQRSDFVIDEELKEIYTLISTISYENFKQYSVESEKEQLSSMFRNEGIDIDLDKYDFENIRNLDSDEMAKLMAEVHEKRFEKNQNQEPFEDEKPKEKKKSQKQLAQEQAEQQKQEFAAKSLKEIYSSLAKIVHPDKELDPNLKLEKEEWMKKLTVAYKNKDLAELLKIERYWLAETKFNPANAKSETFDLYISYLNERLFELKMELNFIKMDPRYSEIDNVLNHNRTYFIEELKNELHGLTIHKEDLKSLIKQFRNEKIKPKTKSRSLLDFIEASNFEFDFDSIFD
jgi:hypothetical protein